MDTELKPVPGHESVEPVPRLRREAIIPVLPRQWLWTYLLIKAMVISIALATMGLLAR